MYHTEVSHLMYTTGHCCASAETPRYLVIPVVEDECCAHIGVHVCLSGHNSRTYPFFGQNLKTPRTHCRRSGR